MLSSIPLHHQFIDERHLKILTKTSMLTGSKIRIVLSSHPGSVPIFCQQVPVTGKPEVWNQFARQGTTTIQPSAKHLPNIRCKISRADFLQAVRLMGYSTGTALIESWIFETNVKRTSLDLSQTRWSLLNNPLNKAQQQQWLEFKTFDAHTLRSDPHSKSKYPQYLPTRTNPHA